MGDTDTEESAQERVAELDIQNTQLRMQLRSQVTQRRIAGIFLLSSGILLAGIVVFPSAQEVLIALAGTGFFGAVIFLSRTSKRTVPTVVAQALNDTATTNIRTLTDELGLERNVSYVPVSSGQVGLYVSGSRHETPYSLYSDGAPTFDEGDGTGLLLTPTGRAFMRVLEETGGELPDDIEAATTVLIDAATDLFRLAEEVETVSHNDSHVSARSQLTVAISGATFGTPSAMDHPIQSLIGTGLVSVLEEPIEVETTSTDEGRALVTFKWKEQE